MKIASVIPYMNPVVNVKGGSKYVLLFLCVVIQQRQPSEYGCSSLLRQSYVIKQCMVGRVYGT